MQEPSVSSSPREWISTASDLHAARALAERLGCPLAIAWMLVARDVANATDADNFLNPTLPRWLDDPANAPGQLLGMAPAVERILRAVEAQERVLIYGDYDVDGTTATVLLKTTLERIGLALDPPRPQQIRYHVPHRIREGYGMRNAILAEAANDGVRLVISVDTGIRAVAEAVEAKLLGLDLIVTDHHLPDSDSDAAELGLPDCLAVINPNQAGCAYPNKHLCGAGVAFKLAHALLLAAAPRTADAAAFLARARNVLLPSFLKLVAIATVADSVPLTGENRTMTALGLAALANPVQVGLRALMQVAKIPLDRAPTATEVGFRIGPRINAAGRMDVASDVVELLLTRDPQQAQHLAEKLDALNTDRRASEAAALASIDEHLPTLVMPDGSYPRECLVLDHPEWHRGVLGILASRVVERTGRPALVLTHADGDAHGSGRSIAGFHLLDAIAAADSADPATPLFHRYGGHAHAVGFSLPSASLPVLRARIAARSATHLTPASLTPAVVYDVEIDLSEISAELYRWVVQLGPFGAGNHEPLFHSRGAVLTEPVRLIQERHICLQLAAAAGSGDRRPAIAALGWSRTGKDWAALCERWNLVQGAAVDLVYRLRHKVGAYANAQTGGLELELCELRPAVVAATAL